MKTLSIIECRTCNAQIHDSRQSVTLMPEEELAFAVRKVPRCSACLLEQDRTTDKKNKMNRKIRLDEL